MSANPIVSIILIVTCGFIFFFVDLYEERVRLHPSLIAGFSIAYFFLVVLPEISKDLPHVLTENTVFEYLFVLIGVTFSLVSEKLILQRVEVKTRKKAKQLLQLKEDLDDIEENLGTFLAENILEDKLDKGTMRNVSDTIISMNKKEEEILKSIEETETIIHDHVIKNLDEFHSITEFGYHAIIGIILCSLLARDLLEGILFFVFAFFMAIVTRENTKKRIFSDLDIELRAVEKPRKKLIVAFAAPIGIVVSTVFDLMLGLELEIVYVFFSFISGVILYTILRELIPEKEQGRPILFLAGVILFSCIIITLRLLHFHLLHL